MMLEQMSLFDFIGKVELEESDQEEIYLEKLRTGDYYNNHIVKKDGQLWWKQELKKKYPKGHIYEEDNKPRYFMICKKCYSERMITDGEEVKDGLCREHRVEKVEHASPNLVFMGKMEEWRRDAEEIKTIIEAHEKRHEEFQAENMKLDIRRKKQ